MAKKRWSVAPEDPQGSFEWRNVTGRRTRQLLRNIEHTAAVHGFLAALTAQAPLLGWEVVQIDPPRRASRHFRHDDRMRAVNPDAFGVLRKGGTDWAFFLEWERRAVRPSTMSDRLAPYLRYYSSHRPMDDHGVKARRPGRLRRRDRPDPLPARGAGGDAGGTGHGAPVGLPQGGHRRPGAAGRRMAHARRMGVAKDPAAPCEPGQTGGSLSFNPAPVSTEYRRTKTMRSRDANQMKGRPRRAGRTVVRLDAAALWRRLNLLNRSQNWLAREIGISPGYLSMLVNEGRAPSGRIRRRMQRALGVDNFHELFTQEDCDDLQD